MHTPHAQAGALASGRREKGASGGGKTNWLFVVLGGQMVLFVLFGIGFFHMEQRRQDELDSLQTELHKLRQDNLKSSKRLLHANSRMLKYEKAIKQELDGEDGVDGDGEEEEEEAAATTADDGDTSHEEDADDDERSQALRERAIHARKHAHAHPHRKAAPAASSVAQPNENDAGHARQVRQASTADDDERRNREFARNFVANDNGSAGAVKAAVAEDDDHPHVRTAEAPHFVANDNGGGGGGGGGGGNGNSNGNGGGGGDGGGGGGGGGGGDGSRTAGNLPPDTPEKSLAELQALPIAGSEQVPAKRLAVVHALRHAWRGYESMAWGADELKPLTRQGTGGYKLGLMILDNLDVLWLAGLHDDFRKGVQWVRESLNLDGQHKISFFETTIRCLAGLLSAYELSGEPLLLEKAIQIGTTLIAR